MSAANDQLIEAKRIQRLLADAGHSVALRLMGSLAVWYYCHDRTDILKRAKRVPRDIDFVYSAGGASAVLHSLAAAGYDCDMRLAQESQGSRIRASRGSQKVDAFADPIILRQTLHLGKRLEACSPCVPLTDLLLLKLQLENLNDRDVIDVCALLATSHYARRECWRLDVQRVQEVVGRKWLWWKAVRHSLDRLEKLPITVAPETKQDYAILAQTLTLRRSLETRGITLKWRLERAADALLPDGNQVDEP